MITRVTHVSLLVRDQEEALRWYVDKLGFEVRSDFPFPGGEGRWLTIAPTAQQELEIVLEPPEWYGDQEVRGQLIGKTPGWVIVTDNCRMAYDALSERGVQFIGPPEEMPWGVSAMLVDLYGTIHNLLEPHPG